MALALHLDETMSPPPVPPLAHAPAAPSDTEAVELSSDLLIDVDDAAFDAPPDLFTDETPAAEQPRHWGRWLWPVLAMAVLAGVAWLIRG